MGIGYNLSKVNSIEEQETAKDINTDRKDIISSKPSVTVGIPVLNEEGHIERVVTGFLETDYPNLVEILVADGGSTDRTREIVKELSSKDSRVKLIDNPEKFQSFGLNKMIEKAEGEIFMRADAHCDYGSNFIKECVDNLSQKDVKNTGGAARFLAYNRVQAGTALAVLSIIGNGGAKHYNPEYEGYADTVPMGCFWTEDLRRLDGFTESNHTNEDAEINYRIQKELNGKIYISPDIKLWYYPRESFYKLFKQYFRYGRGRYLTSTMHRGKIPFRSKAPFLFVGFMILLLLVDQILLNHLLGSFYILGACLGLLLFESARVSLSKREYFLKEVWKGAEKKPPRTITNIIFLFLVFLIMHVAHFSGYGYQLIKMKLFKKHGW